ncbi:MAG: heme-binding domain-containing protein [Bacteroidia bacterium]
MKKKIFIAIAVILVIIQFIRPEKNAGEVYGENDIAHTLDVPADVTGILEKACNDCHSNKTNYPWYTNIQPFGWWINHHVEEGNHEINFSEFNTYKLKRKLHKLEEIAEQVKEGEMPMNSYTWMHSEAKLTDAEKQTLITWALNSKALLDTVKVAVATK